eukprot:COSAG04_NODE_2825_length_3532_cov_1.454413_9_plen_32_part_01
MDLITLYNPLLVGEEDERNQQSNENSRDQSPA